MVRPIIPFVILLSLIGCSRRGGEESAVKEKPGAASVSRKFGAAPVELTIELSANEITTADSLLCRLMLVMPETFEADIPDVMFPEDVPGAVLTRYAESDTKVNGQRRLVREYEVEPMYEGTLTLPALEIYYHESEEVTERTLLTEPMEIIVKETPASADALALKAPRGLITVEQITAEQRRVWPIVAAGLLGAVLAIVLLVYWVRRPRPEPAPPPAHEVAMERLRALVARKLVEQGQIEPFFVEITAIVRDYIEQAFDLRAPEQTTEEFFLSIAAAPAVARHEERLRPFLTAADEVKFALARPEPAVIQRTFDTARDFILQTRPSQGGSA